MYDKCDVEDCSKDEEQMHKITYWQNTNKCVVLLAIWCPCLNEVHRGESDME